MKIHNRHVWSSLAKRWNNGFQLNCCCVSSTPPPRLYFPEADWRCSLTTPQKARTPAPCFLLGDHNGFKARACPAWTVHFGAALTQPSSTVPTEAYWRLNSFQPHNHAQNEK